MKKNIETKLSSRDLITIGILNTIMFVVMILVGIPMGAIPITYPFYTAVVALINGVVFVLLMVRVPKKGTMLITCTFQGILFLINGGFLVMLPCIVAGLIAEVMYAMLKGKKGIVLGYVMYILGIFASSFGPMVVVSDWFFEYFVTSGYDEVFTRKVFDAVVGKIGMAALVLTIVGAIAGVSIGFKLFKKHFKKAGVA